MAEVASLGLKIDGIQDIDRAATALREAADSGDAAEQSIKRVERAARDAKSQISELALASENVAKHETSSALAAKKSAESQEQLAKASKQAAVENKRAAKEVADYSALQRTLDESLGKLNATVATMAGAYKNQTVAINQVTSAMQAATKENKDVSAAALASVAGINAAAAAVDKLANSYQKIPAAAPPIPVPKIPKELKEPIVPKAVVPPEAPKALSDFEKRAASAGMSTKAMSAALRGVPAQFTDIAVSLQGGMSPLTVFLQQGGQLKDMFGGAGHAARALGGYVLGLISPLTVAASAIAVLGLAYYQGAKEIDAFRLALVTTGNSSGLTTSQLQGYAREISNVVGTQGKATEALVMFVQAGVKGDETLRQYTETAIRWEKFTGEGVDAVAEKFNALQKDPLTAALKLNEATNFLTVSVYEQIAALEDQGKKSEAAAVAMGALDAAMREGAANIEKNLGSIERGWNAIKGAAKGAWDAMLNVGREGSVGDKIAVVQKQISERAAQSGVVGNDAAWQAGTKRLQDQLAALQGLAKADEDSAKSKKQQLQQVQARDAWDKIANKAIDDETKLKKDLKAARDAATAAGANETEVIKVLAKIQDDYNKKQPKGKKAAAASTAGVSELASIMARVQATNDYIKALQEQGKAADKVTEGEKLAWKIQGEIDSGRLKASQVVQKQKELEAAKLLQAAQEALKTEEKRIELAQKAAAADAELANARMDAEEKLIGLRQSSETALASYGMSNDQIAEMQSRISIENEFLSNIRKLRKDHSNDLVKAESDAERDMLESRFNERLELTKTTFEKELDMYDEFLERKKEKEGSWEAGATAGIKNYANESMNAYAISERFAQSSLNTMTDAFTNMVVTGKMDMRSLAATVVQELIRIAIQAAISQAAMSFLGFFSGGGGVGGVLGSLFGFSNGGYTGSGGKNEPAGIVHKGEVVFSQSDVASFGGVAAVESLRRSGGSGQTTTVLERIDARQRSGSAPVAASASPVVVNLIGAPEGTTVEQRQGTDSETIIDIFVNDIRRGGKSAKAVSQSFGLSRVGT